MPASTAERDYHAYFRDRGILPETLAANGIRLSPPDETYKAVKALLPAIRWDYGDGYQRYRFLGNPDLFPRNEKGQPIKAKALRGSGNRLYVPRRPDQSVKDLERQKLDPAIPLAIVEGEADTLGVLQAEPKSLVVGISGCWGWKSKKDPILPELRELAMPGRGAVLCPDSDWRHNPKVFQGWLSLGETLKQLGCNVQVVVIESDPGNKLGAGDYVQHHGAAAWASLNRIPLGQWEDLGNHHAKSDGTEETGLPPKDSPAGFYERARRSLLGDEPWICWDGCLYRWGGTHYAPVGQEWVQSCVWQFAASYKVIFVKRDGSRVVEYPFATPTAVRSAIEWIHLSCAVAAVNPPGINCTNGFLELNWDGDRLIPTLSPHHPDRLVLSPPSCEYKPQADPTEYDRLMECLDAKHREIWERTIAASLDLPTVRKFQGRAVKALLLKGSGANGKDTLRAITQQLLGSESLANTSTTDWQAYDNGTYFKVAGIRGKRISWASETSDIGRIEQLQGLKAAITGDPITIERKYKDGVKEPLAAVFLFSLNEMPNISTALKAIESRWGIVPFNKTYSGNPREGELLADPRFKEDPNFIREKILPAFLNTLLRQLQAVVREGIDYSATQGLLDEISREANHLQQFAQDVGLTYDPNSRIPVQQLWERLEGWYLANGYLTYETGSRGAKKAVWQDPGSRTDRLVKASHQVVQRFIQVFPRCKRQTHREGGTGKTITYLAGLNLPEVFSQKEGSQGSQTSEPLQDKASGREPYEKWGSQQGSQRVHNSEPVLPAPQFVNPTNGFVNPTIKEGSHLQPLQDKASVPCDPCEPYLEKKTSLRLTDITHNRSPIGIPWEEPLSEGIPAWRWDGYWCEEDREDG